MWYIVTNVVSIVISIAIVYHYTLKDNLFFVKFLCTISMYLFCSSSILVPIDCFKLLDTKLYWDILLYTEFVLMWGVLPLTISYIKSTQETLFLKVKQSLIDNIRTYIIFTMIAFITIVYFSIIDNIKIVHIINVLFCASNIYGIVLFTLCIGTGIGSLMLILYSTCFQSQEAKKAYAMYSAFVVFSELESVVDAIYSCTESSEINPSKLPDDIDFTGCHVTDLKITPETLLNNILYYRTLKEHSLILLQKCKDHKADMPESLMECKKQSRGHEHKIVMYLHSSSLLWSVKILMAFIVVSILTILLITESLIFIPSMNLVSKLSSSFYPVFILFISLTICCCIPLFKLRNSLYYMYPRCSNEVSMLRCMTFLLRLSTPLSYNFMLILNTESTGLQDFLGPQENIPFFGTTINKIFPLFIIIITILTTCNAHKYILSYLGFKKAMLVSYSNIDEIDILEGQRYIQKYTRKLQPVSQV
jgi:hypothetical protein